MILNLISNAKEVLLERQTTSAKIILTVKKGMLSISDNAGGIHLEKIDRIFEPYFTTKERGLGIGLYMSKMIIEKNMKGSLTVENNAEGAIFTIVLH